MSNRHASSATRSQQRLSLREAVVLADVPEKAVRKDIEAGVLAASRMLQHAKGRVWFEWHHVYVLAAVYGNALSSGRMRRATIGLAEEAARAERDPTATLMLDKYISIDWNKVCADVAPRIALYAAGLQRVEAEADVLGGDIVFKGTRLPVAHIGKMLADGEPAASVLEDFPPLTPFDLAFAELYHRAHPPIGRPRRRSVDAAPPS